MLQTTYDWILCVLVGFVVIYAFFVSYSIIVLIIIVIIYIEKYSLWRNVISFPEKPVDQCTSILIFIITDHVIYGILLCVWNSKFNQTTPTV